MLHGLLPGSQFRIGYFVYGASDQVEAAAKQHNRHRRRHDGVPVGLQAKQAQIVTQCLPDHHPPAWSQLSSLQDRQQRLDQY